MKNQDYVTPHERLYNRRATDEPSVRPGHLAVFLVVALLAATGMIAGALDQQAEDRQSVEVATAVGIVAHKILTSCGL
mgnify:CR=1 FL=1